jgi:hypothetical protein
LKAGIVVLVLYVERRKGTGVRECRRAVLYRGLGDLEALGVVLEREADRRFAWEGERRCIGSGESGARVGMMRTVAFSEAKSVGEPARIKA